ncbi:GNAT family N-acetyltransferase [Paenibacillus tyrfis]|uniref:GNAT family N-acetyltransferase n=1 Tax=Paenibacillus tyrfis TaxID=1501230 RepID=UPI0020A0C6F3|nr:GNAT family N-acetyltransferase [Paenibacillus tyrfis]MCP1308067.1 GNAT family N-acetyltransferase [Paenibacillus tyrfis]
MPFVVRNARAEDVPRLTELMHEYIVGFYQKPWPGTEKIHHLIWALLKKQGGVQFVAEQDGKMIGFATLYFTFSTMKADNITIMNDLFVLEPYRDTEVERRLFLQCQSYTKDQGYAHMTWITAPDNKRAQRFFDQLGGVRVDWVNYFMV